MSVIVQVEAFLDNFKVKMNVWDVLFFSDRQKNTQTLATLEIWPNDVKIILTELSVQDYSEGPLPDKMLGGAEMWVFGRVVKGHEIYIKITLGRPNNPVICISFHVAEYPMTYPLRV
ncbi:MAG: hypothetical protein U0U46_09440 [Saprospiraceae bacterium]